MAKTVSIKVGTSTGRSTVLVSDDQTVSQVLRENHIDYSTAQVCWDGAPLGAADMGKTLADLNVQEGTYIIASQKTQNN